ncbi:MAG: hypothetical protein V1885_03595 [Candidatus Brennerbacteria bacterium]
MKAIEVFDFCDLPENRINLIITGLVQHPKTKRSFSDAAQKLAQSKGICPLSIWRFENDATDKYTLNTLGDVKAILVCVNTFHVERLTVITETPHWLFRVRRLFRKEAPSLEIRFLSSASAPLWYWAKEFLAGILSRIPLVGKTDSRFNRFFVRRWRSVASYFGLYVVDPDR